MRPVFKIEVDMPPAYSGLIRQLAPSRQERVLAKVGRGIAVGIARHFYKASRTRHKTARRFGVSPTRILEFNATYPPRSPGGGKITSTAINDGAEVRISGIPFLSRVFGDLHIRPVNASALTIPINAESVHKSAGQLKNEGWVLFTLGNRRKVAGLKKQRGILFGTRGGGKIVPLYVLAKNAIIPQDRGLLPEEHEIALMAADSAREALKA